MCRMIAFIDDSSYEPTQARTTSAQLPKDFQLFKPSDYLKTSNVVSLSLGKSHSDNHLKSFKHLDRPTNHSSSQDPERPVLQDPDHQFPKTIQPQRPDLRLTTPAKSLLTLLSRSFKSRPSGKPHFPLAFLCNPTNLAPEVQKCRLRKVCLFPSLALDPHPPTTTRELWSAEKQGADETLAGRS